MLESHIKLSSKTEISELLRTIHNETGYWSYIANKSNGKQEIANLEKLIQHAIKINEQGFNTLYDFTNYLQDAINNTEDEGHAELDDTENSVKIMTIHQSKGLEFKVVILYKTNQDKINESLKSKDITIDKEFGILAKLPIRNNYFEDFQQAPIVGLYNYFQNKKSNAELKRLLYVAITRAEEHLIISMRYKGDKLIKNSFAEMIINAMNINLSDETQLLSGPLEFMKFQENNYVTTIENLETEIEISHNVELAELPIDIAKRDQTSNYKFMLEKIKSKEKNEIISASKISLFLQCPRKYQLTYEFGYGELTKLFKDADEYEFNSKEEEENVPGNILGKIVHSILEKGTEHNLLKNEIDFSIEMEDELISYNKVSKNKLRNEIIDLIEGFYNSKSFKKISQLKNYQNEIEIYKRENDYYLYGIIDKLIIENDKIIITDYKTDKISKKNIKEKSETYLNQLMFYAYILSSKFPQINNYQLSLIFIRDDTFSVSKSVNKNEVIEFGYVINDSVNKIRNKQFEEVKPGCKNMEFYLLEECQF
ncbi:MAG: PD-(D/E)XK nuclease family protein [Ignavibacteriales bacterium]|nr:PD-(D/E)XK nuclease family protein [Ignavibacteriales bacterium]